MTGTTIDGFEYRRLAGEDGVQLNVAIGGSGEPIVLLHGFPQTHLMWRHVAGELAGQYTVIVPDLRGYGESDKPEETTPDTYSKRTMARDIVAVVRAVGYEQFSLIGHDRGALVGVRAALDHPETITHLGILDVLPTMDTWDVLHGVDAAVAWHMYLMAQPKGLPERMIGAVADDFFSSFLDAWDPSGTTFPPHVRRRLHRKFHARSTIHRRRLPGHRRYRPRDGPGRPESRCSVGHARGRDLAGLGGAPRIRLLCPMAEMGSERHLSVDRCGALHGRRKARGYRGLHP